MRVTIAPIDTDTYLRKPLAALPRRGLCFPAAAACCQRETAAEAVAAAVEMTQTGRRPAQASALAAAVPGCQTAKSAHTPDPDPDPAASPAVVHLGRTPELAALADQTLSCQTWIAAVVAAAAAEL